MNKKLYFLLFIPVCIPFLLSAQGEFNHWHFGNGITMDFNSGAPIVGYSSSINTDEGSAAVSDCDGKLLFYTDGLTVWNRNNSVMKNGTGLSNGGGSGLSVSPSQPALIIKRPETKGIYYVVTSSESVGLRYSIVNTNLNNGLGEVILKNIVLSTKSTGKIAVTYHSNGSDIWVVTHYANNNQYESFLVTKTGIKTPGVSSYDGLDHNDSHGDLKISPDGRKIGSVVDFKSSVYLGDFNNTTGRVTNTFSVSGYDNPHGVDFSPNSSKMYVNSTSKGIVQFNLSSNNNSVVLNNPFSISVGRSIYGSIQLAPDGKIYVTSNGESALSVINSPDNFGIAAGFSYRSINVSGGVAEYALTNVTLTSPPTFKGPNTVNFNNTCTDEITNFSLGNNSDIIEVLWDFGDPASVIDNYSTKLAPSHKYNQAGTYQGKVTITYACGNETINFTVIISSAPELNLADQTICSGIPTNIGMGSQSNTSYTWFPTTGLNNSSIANPTLTLVATQQFTQSKYTLTATNNVSGCVTSEEMQVTVINPKVDAGPDHEVCSGDTVTIGSPDTTGYVYSWSPTAGVLSPAKSLSEISLENNTETLLTQVYTLTATYLGCVSTDQLTIQVKPLPKINGPKDTTICSLDTISLNVNGSPAYTYQWFTSDHLSGTTLPSPEFMVSNKDTGVVEYFKYVDLLNNGCTYQDTVSVKVTPQAGVGNYQYLCPGFGVALNTYGKGVSFTWTPDQDITDLNSANPIVDPLFSTRYYVTIRDIYGCVYDDSVQVDVNPIVPVDLGPDTVMCRDDTLLIGTIDMPLNAIHGWFPTDFLTHPDSNYTFASPDSNITYILVAQSDTCFGRDTLSVKVNQLPLVNLEKDSSICFRDTIALKATGALNYTWYPNTFIQFNADSALVYPHDTIDYWVQGIDTNGCENADTVTISVRPLPVINLTSDSSVCLTDSIQVVAQGGGSYSWAPSSLVSNDTVVNPFLIPNKDTRFIVTVQGINNCFDNDTIDVKVNPLPTITMTSDTLICDGTKAYLWATGGVKYSWSPTTDLNAYDIASPISSTRTPVDYRVIVTDVNNCVDSLTTRVNINVTPEAIFDYSYFASCPGFDVSFKDKSINADSWNWSFGDGETSKKQEPDHVYEFGLPVLTSLIVGNNNYCFDTATVNFNWKNLEDFIKIFAPNVMTPNGNKINDCFDVEIEGSFDDCTQIEIFNRWGLKVYDSNEFDYCFQGLNEYNFQELGEGTYFYVITINDFVKNGFITLVR